MMRYVNNLLDCHTRANRASERRPARLSITAALLALAACFDGLVTHPDGLPRPLSDVYVDQGPAAGTEEVRALIGFQPRDRDALEERIRVMYEPGHPSFRAYMSLPQWMEQHAPAIHDVDIVLDWIRQRGLRIELQASNRMLVQIGSSVADFNRAFGTTLHHCLRQNPSSGGDELLVYCLRDPMRLPTPITERIHGVVTANMPAAGGTLPGESGDIDPTPPENVEEGFTLAEIASAYELPPLYDAGYRGQGVTLGVVAGATFRFKDLHSFWLAFGVERADPVVIETGEPVVTRYRETTLDVEWAGGLAPEAALIVYQGPDAHNTSILYAFNEAIGRNQAHVITTSFAHREDSEPELLRVQYSDSAMMAAALGVTVVAASGDSARTDTPSASPYVTCVGGTQLTMDGDRVVSERAWESSGSGPSLAFPLPYWQEGVVDSETRAVADVAMHASVDKAYWIRYLSRWRRFGGTSFAAPVFAGMIAVVNSRRLADGLPVVGYLNPILYTMPEVQAGFRDIVSGGTDLYSAGPGWDFPTGWGAPLATSLADALP